MFPEECPLTDVRRPLLSLASRGDGIGDDSLWFGPTASVFFQSLKNVADLHSVRIVVESPVDRN